MSEEEFENLKQNFNTLNDEIDKRIDLNIEIDKKNKIIFSLSALCILSIFASSFLLYKSLYYRNSSNTYNTRLNNKEQYTKNLETRYKDLEDRYEKLKLQANLEYNYDTDRFSPKQTIKKRVDWSKAGLPHIEIPETRYIYHDTKPKYNEASVYVPQEQKSSLPQNDFDKEYQERRLMELESKINNYETERIIRGLPTY